MVATRGYLYIVRRRPTDTFYKVGWTRDKNMEQGRMHFFHNFSNCILKVRVRYPTKAEQTMLAHLRMADGIRSLPEFDGETFEGDLAQIANIVLGVAWMKEFLPHHQDIEYGVEQIIDRNEHMFLVKWYYGDPTWEPYENIHHTGAYREFVGM